MQTERTTTQPAATETLNAQYETIGRQLGEMALRLGQVDQMGTTLMEMLQTATKRSEQVRAFLTEAERLHHTDAIATATAELQNAETAKSITAAEAQGFFEAVAAGPRA